jgi:uncharacterized membrane protein
VTATTGATARARSAPRVTFGAALLLIWCVLTVIWVASTVTSGSNVVKGVLALALMALLAGMEGLEVAVIDRWRTIYPERTTKELAGWLAARQLFVALIVTTATILAERHELKVPGVGTYDSATTLKAFAIVWTGFTVLWFAQIFPKHLAATNPDRYLKHLQGSLFPVVDVVRMIGVSQPGEWTAHGVEQRLDWPAAEHEIEEAPPRRREESLAEVWRTL